MEIIYYNKPRKEYTLEMIHFKIQMKNYIDKSEDCVTYIYIGL